MKIDLDKLPYVGIELNDLLSTWVSEVGEFDDIRDNEYLRSHIRGWFGDKIDLNDVMRVVVLTIKSMGMTVFFVSVKEKDVFLTSNRDPSRPKGEYNPNKWLYFMITDHLPPDSLKLRKFGQLISYVCHSRNDDHLPVFSLQSLGSSLVFRSIIGTWGKPQFEWRDDTHEKRWLRNL